MTGTDPPGPEAGALPPPPPPRWELPAMPDPQAVQALEASLTLPRPLCALLAIRGLEDPDRAKAFLRPQLLDLHPPEAMKDLPEAVDRLLAAVEGEETILVHGDYDVDGMAGTALLTRWLGRMGARVVPFVPHRLRDGYDLGPGGLKAAEAAGATLLVTVDCGILAHEAVGEARSMGMDVIITDHHTPGEELPQASSVLNPNRRDCSYPNPGLCGAGVAYKLCQGLATAADIPQEELFGLLDLVGLATIADLVPLTGENRTLARYGLRALAETENPGLRALLAQAGVRTEEVSVGTVGFALAPRLNALGRLADPMTGLRLLLTESREEAQALATEAEETNKTRQATDRKTLEEALEHLARVYDPEVDFGLVLDSEHWHPGVVGIVASRVAERVHRPTVLVAMDGDRGRGSARSIPGFDLLGAIQGCGDLLERFGGHRQAAGMEVLKDRLPAFREAFNQRVREVLEGTDLRPVLKLELEVEIGELSQDLFRYLKYMGPHGMGNRRPVFLAREVTLAGPARVVGQGHLKLTLLQKGAEVEGIGFHLAERIRPEELAGKTLDVAFQLQENEYRGVRRLQANLKDLRPSREVL